MEIALVHLSQSMIMLQTYRHTHTTDGQTMQMRFILMDIVNGVYSLAGYPGQVTPTNK